MLPLFSLASTFESVVDVLQVLRLDAQMQKLAEELKHENSLLVFGRGYNYATALEAALKVGFCHARCAAGTGLTPRRLCCKKHCFRMLMHYDTGLPRELYHGLSAGQCFCS